MMTVKIGVGTALLAFALVGCGGNGDDQGAGAGGDNTATTSSAAHSPAKPAMSDESNTGATAGQPGSTAGATTAGAATAGSASKASPGATTSGAGASTSGASGSAGGSGGSNTFGGIAIAKLPGWKCTEPVKTTDTGLKYIDCKVGTGQAAKAGDTVTVNYTGYLTDGTKFDSSLDHGQPFKFPLGAGQVIPGWDQGVAGMKIGGKRKLLVPSALAYGPGGQGPIPPNADLVFDVELLKVGA